MNQDPSRDPRTRALAELVHQLRPGWNRPGIAAALHAAAGKPLPNLIRAAVDAALDPAAETPAVIKNRDGSAWSSSEKLAGSEPKAPAFRTPPGMTPVSVADLPQPGDYARGAAQARALIRAAKYAAQDSTQ